jgi:hypothetical protein
LNNKFIEIYFIIDNLYPFDDIFNIKLSRKLSKKDVGMFNLDKIRQQLYKAYEDGFELKEAFVNKKIKFYQSIYYEIKMENDEINRIKIGVGDTIEIEEEMSELPTFAIVRAVVILARKIILGPRNCNYGEKPRNVFHRTRNYFT